MPNDTTTLNGALRQLGETMAANLTTQGVPSTYDEGLTTLAGKILDIQGGGGTRTLTLTADKSILSYYDGDEAILSATLLEDGVAVSGATVEFFNGSTSMGTAQTDSNGVATKTYTSTGAGDVSLKAEADNGMLVSETYSIEDVPYYDGATSDKSSNYATRLASVTHNVDYYQVNTSCTSSTSSYLSTVLVNNLSIPSHFIVTCEINLPNLTSTTGTDEIGLGIFNTNGQSNTESMIDLMSNQAQKGLIVRNPWADNRNDGKLSQDIWYTFELEYDGSVATGTIYNGNSIIWTGTLSSSKVINYIGLCELGKNSGYKFRNLKIKPL